MTVVKVNFNRKETVTCTSEGLRREIRRLNGGGDIVEMSRKTKEILDIVESGSCSECKLGLHECDCGELLRNVKVLRALTQTTMKHTALLYDEVLFIAQNDLVSVSNSIRHLRKRIKMNKLLTPELREVFKDISRTIQMALGRKVLYNVEGLYCVPPDVLDKIDFWKTESFPLNNIFIKKLKSIVVRIHALFPMDCRERQFEKIRSYLFFNPLVYMSDEHLYDNKKQIIV